jgi:hypothetical protein
MEQRLDVVQHIVSVVTTREWRGWLGRERPEPLRPTRPGVGNQLQLPLEANIVGEYSWLF